MRVITGHLRRSIPEPPPPRDVEVVVVRSEPVRRAEPGQAVVVSPAPSREYHPHQEPEPSAIYIVPIERAEGGP